MAEYIIQGQTLTDIADAIREKDGSTGPIFPGDMDDRIRAIETGHDVSGVTAESGDVLTGKVIVDSTGATVDGSMPNNGAVSQTLDAGGSYTIPEGYHDGSGMVTAKDLASQTDGTAEAADILSGETAYVDGVKVTGTMTNNGAVSTSLNAGSSYTVPAGYHNGSGTVTAKDLASQTSATATASDILSGGTAWVNGTKITGNIATKTSSSMTASGATVTAPAGYYASDASKSVSTATQATPSITVSSSGLITASATQTAGYVSAGTKSATKQLTTQAAKTVTPSTSTQTAVASGTYTTGDVKVAGSTYLKAANIKKDVTIFGVTGTYEGTTPTYDTPTISVSSAGLITATANGESAIKQLTTQAAKTVTPSTSSQTAVASGRYTIGAVTVAGDSNLVASNIKSGVSIFGVSGTLAGSSNSNIDIVNNSSGNVILARYTSDTSTSLAKPVISSGETGEYTANSPFIICYPRSCSTSHSDGVVIKRICYSEDDESVCLCNIALDGGTYTITIS